MSRRRRLLHHGGGRVHVREVFAELLRVQWEGRAPWRHFGRVVARIEAGEEVIVPGWQVRGLVPVPMGGHVRLELDGGVTLVEPVRDGVQIVEWGTAS